MKYRFIKLILFIFTIFAVLGCDNQVAAPSKSTVIEQQKQSNECLQSSTTNNKDSILGSKLTQVCPIS